MVSSNLTTEISVGKLRRCLWCGDDKAEKICSGCLAVCYCGPECQKHAWKEHKKICNQLKNARAELFSLKNMDAIFRCPVISLEEKLRAFGGWKHVRTLIEVEGADSRLLKYLNSDVHVGREVFMFTMYGIVTWKMSFKTKNAWFMRKESSFKEYKSAGFDFLAPWLSNVDQCRRPACYGCWRCKPEH